MVWAIEAYAAIMQKDSRPTKVGVMSQISENEDLPDKPLIPLFIPSLPEMLPHEDFDKYEFLQAHRALCRLLVVYGVEKTNELLSASQGDFHGFYQHFRSCVYRILSGWANCSREGRAALQMLVSKPKVVWITADKAMPFNEWIKGGSGPLCNYQFLELPGTSGEFGIDPSAATHGVDWRTWCEAAVGK